ARSSVYRFQLIKKIEEFGLFPPIPKSMTYPNREKRTLDKILIDNSPPINGPALKRRLLAAKLVKNRCALCKIDPIWQGKPLSFHVDHINGRRTCNLLSNLRLLCLNCHSQTNTFSRSRK